MLRDLLYLPFLLLWPTWLRRVAVDDGFRLELRRSRQFAQTYQGGISESEKSERFGHLAENVRLLNARVWRSLGLIMAALAAALAVDWIMSALALTFTEWGASLVQALSLVAFVWATLGLGGWPIQTIKGDSFAERLDRLWFRLLYAIGTFLGGLGWLAAR